MTIKTTPMGVQWPTEWDNPFITEIEATEQCVDNIREDSDLMMIGGGTVELSGDSLSWDAPIYVYSSRIGTFVTIAAGSLTVNDGQSIFFTPSARPMPTETRTLSAAAAVPASAVWVGTRSGTSFSLRGGVGLKSGLWIDGAGTSSLLRDGSSGAATGAFAINAGWGGDAGGDYSFQGGRDNIISSDSHHSVTFGGGDSGSSLHNVVGGAFASPQSLVIGENNAVDGDSLNRFGFNLVVAKDADVNGDSNSVHGWYHTVSGGNCWVDGYDIEVDGNGNAAHGYALTVTGLNNAIFGNGSVVDADYCFSHGYQIDSSSDYCMSFGASHDIGLTTASPFSFVGGSLTVVDGVSSGYNSVVAYNSTVTGDYNTVSGYAHSVTSNYCLVGGASNTIGSANPSPYSVVWGNGNNVDAEPTSLLGYNYVFGQSNNIDADGSVVFGSTNTISANCIFAGASGYTNILGSTVGGQWMYVWGASNTVDGYLDKGVYEGHNYIFGNGNNIEGTRIFTAGDGIDVISPDFYYSAFFGYDHTIGTSWPVQNSIIAGSQHIVDGEETYSAGHAVFGLGHVVSNHCNLVAGENHDVLDSYNVVGGYQNYIDGTGNCVVGNLLDLDGASASAAFGDSNTIEDLYNIISGYGNTIYLDSDYCAILGRSNTIGFQYASPHSAVFGYANGLDGDATNELGCNIVAGYYNSIAADYSVVAGYSNTLQSDYCAVLGASNVVGTTDDCHYSLVAGQGNTVNGPSGGGSWNIVAGYGHVVYGSAEAVFGYNNSVGSTGGGETYNLVAGSSHTVVGEWHIVSGWSHDVSDQSNAVFGSDNDVSGNGNVVGGESHLITDSGFCGVFGSNNEIGTTYESGKSLIAGVNNFIDGSSSEVGYNFLVGYTCDIEGDYNAVSGFSHLVTGNFCTVLGNDHTVGATYAAPYSIIAGDSHTVDGGSYLDGCNAVFGYSHVVNGAANVVAGWDHSLPNNHYCAVFGQNHTLTSSMNRVLVFGEINDIIGGGYQLVGGYDNTSGSGYGIVQGRYNIVGATYVSPYSLVIGDDTDVDGSSSAIGFNCVIGDTLNVDGDYNGVWGLSNTVAGSRCMVQGDTQTASSDDAFMMGDNNTIYANSQYSAAFGDDVNIGLSVGSPWTLAMGHDIDHTGYNDVKAGYAGYSLLVGRQLSVVGPYAYVFGRGNTVSDTTNIIATMVMGSNITVGATNDAPYSAIFGDGHDVDGDGSDGNLLVAGADHNVDTSFGVALGNTCTLSGQYGFVDGLYAQSTVAHGRATGHGSKARWHGQSVHTGYIGDGVGQAQNTLVLSAHATHASSPAAFVQLRPDGSAGSEDLGMVVDTTYYFHYMVVARKANQGSTPQTKTWYGRFAAQRDSGSSSLVGSPTPTADFATSNGDEASWDFQISVASDAIVFEGKGSADATNATEFQLHVYGPEICVATGE